MRSAWSGVPIELERWFSYTRGCSLGLKGPCEARLASCSAVCKEQRCVHGWETSLTSTWGGLRM